MKYDKLNINKFRSIDYKFTKAIYDLFDNKNGKYIPKYLGLIPYEIYVLPGMYISILLVVWLGTPNPIQFHLLPHFFAYSIFQLLKRSINTPRPGCHYREMNKYIDKGHCKHGSEWQSFPSGHAGIAASLATALFMEMMYSDNPHFFEIKVQNINDRKRIAYLGILVSIFIILHRVSNGYHSLFDTIIGCIIGITIGFISWTSLEYFKKKYNKLCEEKIKNNDDNNELCDHYKFDKKNDEISYWINEYNLFKTKIIDDPFMNKMIGISRILISIPILWLLYNFITKDIFNLTSLKH